jgi:hypothetical protein
VEVSVVLVVVPRMSRDLILICLQDWNIEARDARLNVPVLKANQYEEGFRHLVVSLASPDGAVA